MADTKISALTAGTTIAGTETIPMVQSAATVSTTPNAIKTWTLTAPVTVTEAVGSTALTITGATQTASFPVLSMTQTWNSAGTTFTALKLNVTSTASGSSSLLVDLQVGGSSKLKVDKIGNLTTSGTITCGSTNLGDASLTFSNGVRMYAISSTGMLIDGGAAGAGSLMLGGTTSAYPLMKRNGTGVAYRLADDSADAPISCLYATTVATTVGALPSAATAGAGARMFVTDANAITFLSTVAAGGANKVPVVSDGTNWLIG